MAEVFAILLVVAVCIALFAGYPVAFTLGGLSLRLRCARKPVRTFSTSDFSAALPQRIFGVMTNGVLIAIPLFIFMGVMLERSRIAEDLLETMGRLFGPLRGGLGISVIVVGVLLAAAKGVVGATTATMGLIVLPAMLRFGYDPRLAAGIVAATATLAQLFPPATVLVLLGDQLGNAYQAAQLSKGIFAPASVTVSDLFAGALRSRPAAGRALYSLRDRGCGAEAAGRARDPARSECAAGRALCSRKADRRAGRAAGADRARARLDPRRHRDADRSRSGRGGRRHRAGGVAQRSRDRPAIWSRL